MFGGKCFVIDKETQTSQNILVHVRLHSFITLASFHFAVFKTSSVVLFKEGKKASNFAKIAISSNKELLL